MYILINQNGVKTALTLSKLNKKAGITLEKSDFKRLGADWILNMTNEDYEFVKDRKQLSRIIMSRLFKKESGQWLLYVMLVIQFLLLLK